MVNEKVHTYSYRTNISEEVISKMMMTVNSTVLYTRELLREYILKILIRRRKIVTM